MKKTILKLSAALFVILMTLQSALSAYAITAEAADSTVTVTYDVTYFQTNARSMLELVNDFRTGDDAWYWNEDDTTKTECTGLSELTYDYELEAIAMQRAAEIALSYSHTRPDGLDCWTACDDVGYVYYAYGENIAAGYTSASEVFAGWQEADEDYSGQGHRRNMLSSKYTSIGIACVYYNGCYYWVQEFSDATSDTTETEANDETTTVSVDVLSSSITSATLDACGTYELVVGETMELPTVTGKIVIEGSWPAGVTVSVEIEGANYWSVKSGGGNTTITNDRLVSAVGAGTETLMFSLAGTYTTATIQVYDEPVFEWSDDYTSCTAVFTTYVDGETVKESVACDVTSSVIKEATCEETGTVEYTAVCTFGVNNKEYSDTATVTTAALGHDWANGTATWTWASDYSSATLTLTCANDNSHTSTGPAEVSSETTEATCDDSETTTYTATCTLEGEKYTDTKTVETGKALGHNWEETWDWASDYSTVTVTLICKNEDSHTETGTAEITSVTTDATCEEDGQIAYTAAYICTLDDSEHTDSQTAVIEATGHDWEATFNWAKDYSTATVTLTCKNDNSHTETDEAAVAQEKIAATCEEAGQIVYTATYECEGEIFIDSISIEIEGEEATGHDWDADTSVWTWASDYSSATLTFICLNDSSHTLTCIGSVTSVTTAATETEDGKIVYTATYTASDGVKYTSTRTVTLSATGSNSNSSSSENSNEDDTEYYGSYTLSSTAGASTASVESVPTGDSAGDGIVVCLAVMAVAAAGIVVLITRRRMCAQ